MSTNESSLLAFVEQVAFAAAVAARAHPGCGAIAALTLALQNAPVEVPAVEVQPHDERADVEAYAEVRRLTSEVANLKARLAEQDQGALFGSSAVAS